MRIRKTGHFFQNVAKEFSKINWPTLSEVIQSTVVVGIVVGITSLFLWGMDSTILKIIKLLTRNTKG